MQPFLYFPYLFTAKLFAGDKRFDRGNLFRRENVDIAKSFKDYADSALHTAGSAVHAGVQFQELSGGYISRVRSSFLHNRICQQTQGGCKDVEHLAERKIGQADETGQEMYIPEQRGDIYSVQ